MIIEGSYTSQRNISLRFSHNGKISINAPLMRTLSYSLGYSESINDSRTDKIISAGEDYQL